MPVILYANERRNYTRYFNKILHGQILYEYLQWLQNYCQRQNMDAQTAVNSRKFADIHKGDSGVCLRPFLDFIFFVCFTN